jgi:hypothetical protein
VQRCDTILWTAFGCAMAGALAGVLLAGGMLQELVYAAAGVWGGALAGGLLGAVRFAVASQRGEDRRGAGGDLRAEAPDQLAPAGL